MLAFYSAAIVINFEAKLNIQVHLHTEIIQKMCVTNRLNGEKRIAESVLSSYQLGFQNVMTRTQYLRIGVGAVVFITLSHEI